MTKRALITGVTGQDGAYLAKFLLDQEYEVFGTYRRSSTPNFWRLDALGVIDKINFLHADLNDMASLLEAVTVSEPDEIYNLGAQSFVGASFEAPLLTGDVDGLGAARVLEVVRSINPKIRIYQASSSEIYGNVANVERGLTEETPMLPVSPYAAGKLYAYNLVRIYREGYGLFAANGILFNHESPLRGLEFVTRKITNAAAQISLGLRNKLELGNLEARRDWGFAAEYVQAMWKMLQLDKPSDYVIATGSSYSVQDVLVTAFESLGIDWQKYVTVDKRQMRPLDVHNLVGDSSKAKADFDWNPATSFKELIESMAAADYDRWRRRIDGEVFPWDAPSYPSESVFLTRGPQK